MTVAGRTVGRSSGVSGGAGGGGGGGGGMGGAGGDGRRDVTRRGAGDSTGAWGRGVHCAEQVGRAEVAEPQDVVVTSCAGYPLDTTW